MWWWKAGKLLDWKFIGNMEIGWDDKSRSCINFYMTENNERRVEIIPDTDARHVRRVHPEVFAWVAGGRFPSAFQPCDDPLGEMLSRMIDAKLMRKTNV